MATVAAANLFLETLGPKPPTRTGLHDLFRRMGYGEASEGHDLVAFDAALRLGHLEALELLRSAADRGHLPLSALTTVSGELSTFVEELAGEAHTGSGLYLAAQVNDHSAVRRSLLQALLHDDMDQVVVLSERATWPVPDSIVVIAVEAPLEMEWPDDKELAPALVDTASTPVLLVMDERAADAVVSRLRRVDPGLIIARSWAVSVGDAGHAKRWAMRALHLVSTGAIPRQPVVDCSRYFTQLWLQAEPALRSQLVQTLLGPLLAESANSREILSSTLLIWLRTRESAPAIASLLGVHPQTVRYRWRKLNELLGDSFQDPARLVQMLMVLEATLPLWTAGDQSDVERYRAERRLRPRR